MMKKGLLRGLAFVFVLGAGHGVVAASVEGAASDALLVAQAQPDPQRELAGIQNLINSAQPRPNATAEQMECYDGQMTAARSALEGGQAGGVFRRLAEAVRSGDQDQIAAAQSEIQALRATVSTHVSQAAACFTAEFVAGAEEEDPAGECTATDGTCGDEPGQTFGSEAVGDGGGVFAGETGTPGAPGAGGAGDAGSLGGSDEATVQGPSQRPTLPRPGTPAGL